MSITLSNREGVQYGFTVSMTTVICCRCSIPFAMPVELDEFLQRSQERFYCPNGHGQSYSKSTEQILREKLEKQKQTHEIELRGINNNLQWTREQRDRAIKERTATKGQLTKLKNRVKNGVCPCCNRSFHNLQQHMQKQHPEFDAT